MLGICRVGAQDQTPGPLLLSLPAGMLTRLLKNLSPDTEGYVVHLKTKVSEMVSTVIH